MRDIDIALLRAFVAVVDKGNFSRAARQLNRTQSALSMQIKRLEDIIGSALFERAVRPPMITSAGELLIAHAREMLALNDAALQAINNSTVAGQVRLALMEDYASKLLGPVLTRFQTEYPAVEVEIHTGLTSSFMEQIGKHFDLVIAMVPDGTTEGELLYRGKSVWAGATHFDPAAFDPLPLALFQQGCYFRRWATTALDNAGMRWRMGLVSSSLGAVTAMVREGNSLSVFKDITLPRDLRIFGKQEGLPDLPDFEIRLFRAPGARLGAANKLSEFFKDNFHSDHVIRLSEKQSAQVLAK